MESTQKSYLALFGPTLVELGWSIVPLKPGLKYPVIEGWQEIEATPDTVATWLANGHAKGGIGLLTAATPVIDVDCYDAAVSKSVMSQIEELYGERMEFVKVGRAPKFSVLTRLPDGAPSFVKRKSTIFLDEQGRELAIEILADGQQTVLYHDHPDTKKPYDWPRSSIIDSFAEPSDLPAYNDSLTDELFEWWDEVGDLMGWTRKKDATRSDGVSGRDLMDVAERIKEPVGLSESQIKKLLPANDDLDYDEWVDVLAMISHECQDDPATGYQIALDWSTASPKHDDREFEKTWRSFRHDATRHNVKTMRTLMKDSEAAAEVKAELKQERKEQQEQDQEALLKEMLHRYILITDGKLVYDTYTPPYDEGVKLEDFKASLANIPYFIEKEMANGNIKTERKNIADIWLGHPDRMTADGVEYDPELGEVIKKPYLHRFSNTMREKIYINQFYLPPYPPTEKTDRLQPFFDHLDYLIPDKDERDWFIDWMAFTLQRPGTRCKVTPLHISQAHGTGRGWLVKLMTMLVGPHNQTKTKMSVLSGDGSAGQYQNFLNNSVLCFIDEVKESDKRYTVSDKIRDYLTEDYLQVNIKGTTMNTQRVYVNFFMQSNHSDALVIPEEDRRIMVLTGPDVPQNPEYYNRLYDWLDADNEAGVRQLFHWLRRRDLSRFNWQVAMKTTGRAQMIGANISDTEEAFRMVLTDVKPDVATPDQFRRMMVETAGIDLMDIDQKMLEKLLKQHAWRTKQIKVEGQPVRVWVFTKKIKRGSDDTNKGREQIRELIER